MWRGGGRGVVERGCEGEELVERLWVRCSGEGEGEVSVRGCEGGDAEI